MYSLVYRSTLCSDFSMGSFVEMLYKAREFNAANNITGCLLHHQGKIVQLLEGNKKEVKSLFERIKKDTRHKNVLLLTTEETFFRIFGDWSMIYEDVDKTNHSSKKRELFENIYHSSRSIYLPSTSKLTLWSEVNLMLDETVVELN